MQPYTISSGGRTGGAKRCGSCCWLITLPHTHKHRYKSSETDLQLKHYAINLIALAMNISHAIGLNGSWKSFSWSHSNWWLCSWSFEIGILLLFCGNSQFYCSNSAIRARYSEILRPDKLVYQAIERSLSIKEKIRVWQQKVNRKVYRPDNARCSVVLILNCTDVACMEILCKNLQISIPILSQTEALYIISNQNTKRFTKVDSNQIPTEIIFSFVHQMNSIWTSPLWKIIQILSNKRSENISISTAVPFRN